MDETTKNKMVERNNRYNLFMAEKIYSVLKHLGGIPLCNT